MKPNKPALKRLALRKTSVVELAKAIGGAAPLTGACTKNTGHFTGGEPSHVYAAGCPSLVATECS